MPSPSDAPRSAQQGTARRTRRKEARPGELLEAALALFVEKGYAATRVEEVAARAGVSKGTLFLYFPSKEDLFKAMVRENIVGRFAEWGEQMDQFSGSTVDMLRTCYQAWWERIGNTPASGITKLMLCEAGNFPGLASFYQTEVIAPAQALMRRALARGVATGEFRPMDLDDAVQAFVSPLLMLMLFKHSPGACGSAAHGQDPLPYLLRQLDCLLYGVVGRPAH